MRLPDVLRGTHTGADILVEAGHHDEPLTPPRSLVRLHTYAASFGDDFARDFISTNMRRGENLLDPWAGSATGPVQARMLGINGIGIDIDPIACLIANVSLTPYSIDELDHVLGIVTKELSVLETELSPLDFGPKSWLSGTTFSVNGFRTSIPDNRAIDFWFTPVQRGVLAFLVNMARSMSDPRYQAIVQLAISSSIIRKWPNTISLAMDIDHSRPHRVFRDDITVASQIGIFRKVLRDILIRLKTINAPIQNHFASWQVIEGDTKDSLKRIEPNSIDYVLTSPPYFNAIDYPRAHKFSQWWLWPERPPVARASYLGLSPGIKEQEDVIRCNAILPEYTKEVDAILEISPAIQRNLCKYIVQLNDVVIQFRHLLKKNGKATFVVGNNVIKGRNIPTSEMLATMLERSGLSNVNIESRNIRTDRRRYPYGITGFKGLMTSEYVVKASNS